MMRSTAAKVLLTAMIALPATFSQACECGGPSRVRQDAAVDETAEDAGSVISGDAATEMAGEDAEAANRDSSASTSIDQDSGQFEPIGADSGRPAWHVDSGRPALHEADAAAPPSPRPVVTPDELTVEVLDEYHSEPDRAQQPPSREPDDCGYTMTIDYEDSWGEGSAGDESVQEVRHFDQKGRLLLQQSDDLRTEVRYDRQGRPITIWIDNVDRWGAAHLTESCIVAVEYNTDGSAVAKSMTQVLAGFPGCDYLVFDDQLRLITRARDDGCDDVAERVVEIGHDPQSGRPLTYVLDTQHDESDEEISWSYPDDGRQVKAEWTDLFPGTAGIFPRAPWPDKSAIVFSYDDAGVLLSVEADYENDGQKDEYSYYFYNERGSLLRQETYIDGDQIIDLLRTYTYSEDGRPLSETLRNLTPPGMGMYFHGSEFEGIEPATVRAITYTYDSDSRLVQREAEDVSQHVIERLTYDARGRLVERSVSTEYLDEDDGTHMGTTNITCSNDIRCDETTVIDSDAHRCELGTPIHHLIFPYQALAKEAHQSYGQRVPYVEMFPYVSGRSFLGIPWY